MSSVIGSVGAVGGTMHMANPGAASGGSPMSLSEMAQSALRGVGGLQSQFQTGAVAQARPEPMTVALQPGGSAPGTAAAKSEAAIGDSAQMLAAQIESSSQVQAQLTRFVAASSMSSSLGRNLNMFLRGQ